MNPAVETTAPPARHRPPKAAARLLPALVVLFLLVTPSALAAMSYQVGARSITEEERSSARVHAGGKTTLMLPARADHPTDVEVVLSFSAPVPTPPGWALEARLIPPSKDLPSVREADAGPTIRLALGELNPTPEPQATDAESPEEAMAWFESQLGTRGAGAWQIELSIPASTPATSSPMTVTILQRVTHLEPAVLHLVKPTGSPALAANPLWQWSLLALVPVALGLGWYTFRIHLDRARRH